MQIIDRSIIKQLGIATLFIVAILAVLVLLTQSLKYLELIVNSGATALSFWLITFLSLPSFLEVILPIGTVAATLFVYNRMTHDSELVVLRALGFSPLRLAGPALKLSCILAILLFFVMGWVAPSFKADAIKMRKDITAQMTTLIFREGVFTKASNGLMVFVRNRTKSGYLEGIIIHDSRKSTDQPTTIFAKRGILVATDTGHRVVVYDGSRQEFDPLKSTVKRLDFDRYTIDMPQESKTVADRRAEADELILPQLLDSSAVRHNRGLKKEYRVELQKRFITPLMIPTFCLIGLAFLLSGEHSRRGQNKKILLATFAIIVVQILFLSSYNIAKHSSGGFALMLISVLLPSLSALFFLSKDKLFYAAHGYLNQSGGPYEGHVPIGGAGGEKHE